MYYIEYVLKYYLFQGDSGGPAVQDGKLYGLTSAGSSLGCSYPNMPSIFTSVIVLREWIEEQINIL